MALEAGRLRHRIDIEKRVTDQDPETGGISDRWSLLHEALPAAIEPITQKEYLASASVRSEATTRIILRFVAGLDSKYRFVHGRDCCSAFGVEIFNPAGKGIRDRDTGLEYITVPCSEGVNDG